MPVIHLLIALTFFVVLGYFVLRSSERAEGRMKTFGRYLAIWLFILPVLALIAAAANGGRHGGWRTMRHGPPPHFGPMQIRPPGPAPGPGPVPQFGPPAPSPAPSPGPPPPANPPASPK
jgi:hypothetical protein